MARLVQLAFGIYLESLSIQRKSYNYKSRVMELLTTRRKERNSNLKAVRKTIREEGLRFTGSYERLEHKQKALRKKRTTITRIGSSYLTTELLEEAIASY